MARIIFKCRYLKNASSHLSNMVQYVATREGAEKLPEHAGQLPVTAKQQRLIASMVQELPETADLFEYDDYVQSPTQENAAELITMAVEQNLDLLGKRKNIIGYVAGRPGVERQGAHGLFSDAGVPIVLSQVAQEVAEHRGNVWTNVISLRREDAARLGYDNARAWQALLRSQRNKLAEEMKIQPGNLRWYAAFHNEGHHPHVHLIAYSTNPREAYVTKEAIDRMRSSLAREIFKQDLLQVYEEQTHERDKLKTVAAEVMRKRIAELQSGTCDNPDIGSLLTELAERLKRTSGKKQYGYLKALVKALVNQIVDQLEKDERVAECYAAWYELRHKVLRTYSKQLPPRLPLSQQKEFKSLKNRVIAEAMALRELTDQGAEQGKHREAEAGNKAAQNFQRNADAETTAQPVWGEIPVSQIEHSAQPISRNIQHHQDISAVSNAGLAAVRLLHHLGELFENEHRQWSTGDSKVDSKLRRKLRKKKMSQGHAQDDHAIRHP